MPSASPKIAIIILNWNGLEDTKECLASVFTTDYSNFSLYLVDNASKVDELSNIKKFAKDKEPSITYIQNNKNLGFAGGNNVGIKQAIKDGAEYIFLLNNDTVVDKNFLRESLNAFDDPKKDINHPVGIVATTMINYYNRNKLDNIGHDLLTTGDTIPRKRNSKNDLVKLKIENSQNPMGACAGAALYSSKMLKQIGLLDEEFFLNYEDSDLSLRAIVQGWSCVWAPQAKIFHKINASIEKVKDATYRIRSQRNQLWAYFHNTPLPVIILNAPWMLLRDLLVIILSIITFRWTITKIFLLSRWEVVKSLPTIIKKRRQVLKNQKVSSWWYWTHQKSWLSTYWKYFQEIILKRKNSVMEKS